MQADKGFGRTIPGGREKAGGLPVDFSGNSVDKLKMGNQF
jgi:hypothetical protein